jgi:hypothetical protein
MVNRGMEKAKMVALGEELEPEIIGVRE